MGVKAHLLFSKGFMFPSTVALVAAAAMMSVDETTMTCFSCSVLSKFYLGRDFKFCSISQLVFEIPLPHHSMQACIKNSVEHNRMECMWNRICQTLSQRLRSAK